MCAYPDCSRKIRSVAKYCYRHEQHIAKCKEFKVPVGTDLRKGKNNHNWNGGVFKYPNHTEMKRVRLEKIEQVGARCEECGEQKIPSKLDVHHRDGSKSNHDIDNLLLLCKKCHLGIYHKGEIGRKRKKVKGLIVREVAEKVGCSFNTAKLHLTNLRRSKKYGEAIDKLIGGTK